MGGLALGFAAGFSFTPGGDRDRTSVVAAPSEVTPPVRGRNVITGDEIRDASAATAFDVVQLLRPEWLTGRGMHSTREASDELSTVQVYLDGTRVGGIEQLREFIASNVASLRYFPPAAAIARWGSGHSHGAIEISTR